MHGLILIAMALSQVTEFKAKVTEVQDGDTIQVQRSDATMITIRFILSDAPEKGQPWGDESREYLQVKLLNKDVVVRAYGVDSYGRTLAEVIYGNENVNLSSIREGHAWWFYHYHPDRTDAARAEIAARSEKLGLWQADAPIYPRAWRRGARLGKATDQAAQGNLERIDLQGVQRGVFILAVLPNPDGSDDGAETVTLANSSDGGVSINRWRLMDDDGGVFVLAGNLEAGVNRKVTLTRSLQLGNNGDRVILQDADGHVVHTLAYPAAASGRVFLAE